MCGQEYFGPPCRPFIHPRHANTLRANDRRQRRHFDARHNYAGSIPGVHEILRRQGLLEHTYTLKHDEVLSLGQAEEITRACHTYPHLTDDAFVAENLGRWLSEA